MSSYRHNLSTLYEASRLLIHKENPTFLFHFCFGNIKSFGPQKKNSKCIQKLSLLVTKNRSSAVAGVSSGNNWIMVMSHSSSILFSSFYPLATQLVLRFSVFKIRFPKVAVVTATLVLIVLYNIFMKIQNVFFVIREIHLGQYVWYNKIHPRAPLIFWSIEGNSFFFRAILVLLIYNQLEIKK